MENTKTSLRLSRLRRLEEVAQEQVRQNRMWLRERHDELDAATHERRALEDYRDSYRTVMPVDSPATGPSRAHSVSLASLAHRQQFVSRLCLEIDRLSDLERRRGVAFEQQREKLSEALRRSTGLSQLCERQVRNLEQVAARDEQRQLDEAGQVQHARAVTAAEHEESQHV